jgi:LPXTG-site transpeptidase (sortase) family protein
MANKQPLGEMPSTGGARPGPSLPQVPRSTPRFKGVRPIAIRIPSIQVDSEIERRPIIEGNMQAPTGPFVVAWYGATGRLGVTGNAVFAGHVDYVNIGPAVFARVGELTEGDTVELTGEDVNVYRYSVISSHVYDSSSAPVLEIIGRTETESITLITCAGTFDASSHTYNQRLVVSGERLD